jgi:2,4-dienoyl-CoA reductase-like NADH-dependent reductase (Old Yellow Enzyme family)
MNFIFMLTVGDRTIPECLAVADAIRPLRLKHIGFKDIGVPYATLEALQARLKSSGATTYLEVVSTSTDAAVASAKAAAKLGVDKLLGGAEAAPIIAAAGGTACYPFCGRPEGHPTRLGGSPASVAEDCRRLEAMGARGVDLLAYRATEADPIDLVRAARKALKGELIVAGSIASPERIRAVRDAGADAFTIGTSAIAGTFAKDRTGLTAQLEAILDAVAQA